MYRPLILNKLNKKLIKTESYDGNVEKHTGIKAGAT
jgi:hypothetical protein